MCLFHIYWYLFTNLFYFCLDSKCYTYIYLLNSVFIGIDCGLILVEGIYLHCISIEFIGLVFIVDFICMFIHIIGLDLFSFIQYMYYKIY